MVQRFSGAHRIVVNALFLLAFAVGIFGSGKSLAARDDADKLFDRAGQAQNAGDFEFAAELWEQFLADFKDHAQSIKARHYLGVCRMTLKEYAKAAKAFAAVIADPNAEKLPQLEETFYYLGWCQYSLGQNSTGNNSSLSAAVATFDKQIKRFPKGKLLDQAWFLKGEALYFLGRKKESINAYRKVVDGFKKSESRPNALYALGVSEFEIANYDQAIQSFDRFLTDYADNSLGQDVRLFRAEATLQKALKLVDDDKAAAGKLFVSAEKQLAQLAGDKKFPKRDEALYNRAICQVRLGQQAEAAETYARVATDFPDSSFGNSAAMAAGKLFLRIKDFSNAEKWFTFVAKHDPTNADEANHWKCQSLLRRNQPGAAVKLARQAIGAATNPDYKIRLQMDLADGLYAVPDSKADSIAIYEKIAADSPDHALAPQALYNAAFTSMEVGKHPQGIQLADRFLGKYPADSFAADVAYVRAECLLLDRKYPVAETAFKKLIDSHPEHESAAAWLVRYGLVLYMQDKYQAAIDHLVAIQDRLKIDSQKAEAGFLVGASRFYQKKMKQAIDDLEQAVTYGKELKQIDEALILLAQALADQKQHNQALQKLKQLVSDYPDSGYVTQAHYLAGQYHSIQKKFAPAISEYEAVIQAPKSRYTPFAHYGKGWALLNSRKPKPAIEQFTTLMNDFPEHDLIADAHYSRAVGLRRTGKFRQAVEDIDACLKAKPDFANLVSALYEKGMAQSGLKDYSGAAKTFEKLVEGYPDHRDAVEFLYQLAWAQKLADRNDDALATFARLVKKFPGSDVAAEAHYHLAENAYAKKDYTGAIAGYEKALAGSNSEEIAEKATYKLAWSHYQLKKYDAAQEKFAEQVEKFSKGPLADSARFMVAECSYQQDQFADAAEKFAAIRDRILASKNTSELEKSLACLHAGESANKIRQYETAVDHLAYLIDESNKNPFRAEAYLELGNAHRGLKNLDKAMAAFKQAFDLSDGETGARAGFLVGEVLFEQKKHEAAIRQYKLVVYGYGGTRAPEPIQKWQCSSAYETARCYHVRIKGESDSARKKKLLEQATKFYNYVLQNYPTDRLAADSRKQLEILEKLE